MSTGSGRRPRLAGIVAVACGVLLLGGACSGNSTAENAGLRGKDIDQELEQTVPESMLELKVQKENIKTELDKAQKAYVDRTVLYSVRTSDDLVQATIQISRFADGAEYEKAGFRRRVVQQLGSSVPQTIRVGEQSVYVTQAAKSRISSWFKGRHLYVLSVREDFDQPRNLLREALELEP